MKRHTLFIYIAALLTMLGTALSMSAQNKSFTVNRNDGASQKYSYSQGDRLVLSREDSQGKKYADFVEQQVYVGNAVHNIPLTSIESITFDTQATEDEGKTFTVQESGGKIEYDDITIDFPSGTFKGDTKVNISDIEKGFIDGNRELSNYYKVKFSSGVMKNLKVAVKMPEVSDVSDEKPVKMQFAMMGWAPSTGEETMLYNFVDVDYSNGAYEAEIPEMEGAEEAGESEVYFGITTSNLVQVPLSASTREGGEILTRIDNYLHLDYSDIYIMDELTAPCIRDIKYSYIPDAMNKIEELGFKKDNQDDEDKIVIHYYLVNENRKNFGCVYYSFWGKKFSQVHLNFPLLRQMYNSGNDDKEIKRNRDLIRGTIIHETFHFYQQFYDPRWAYLFGYHSTATILDEATSTWSERFYGNELSSQIIENAYLFLPSFYPEHEEIYKVDDNGFLSRMRFSNSGYGAATLIEYLTQKTGNYDIVLKLWEDRKKGDPHNTRSIIDRIARENGIDIFTTEAYHDFVEMLGCNKLYPTVALFGFKNLVGERPVNGEIGVLKRTISNEKPVKFTNWAFGYGALVEELTISGNYNGDASHGLDNTIGYIKQKEVGLKTWVYRLVRNGDYVLCGITQQGIPVEIKSDWFLKGNKGYINTPVYLVTMPYSPVHDFRTEEKILSVIEASVGDLVTPNELSFNSDGGKETLKVFSEVASFSAKPDADWITVKEDLSKKTIDVSVSESTTGRNSFVTVDILNDKLETIETVKIPVKQEGLVFKVEPDTPLEFEADGGTKTLTVTTSQPQWSVTKKTGDWFNYSTSGNKLTVTAFANPTSDPRDGYLEICALNEKNEKVSEPVTIKVKQKAKVVVKLQMSLHINISLFDGRNEQDLKPIVVNLSNDENKTEIVVNRNKDDDRYQVMCKGEDGEISFDSDVDIINDLDRLKSGKVEINNLSCMRDGRFSLVATGSSGNSYKEDKNSITYGWDYGSIIYFHDTMTGATLPSPSGKWIVTGGISITRPK